MSLVSVNLGDLRKVASGASDAHVAIANTVRMHVEYGNETVMHVPQSIADLCQKPTLRLMTHEVPQQEPDPGVDGQTQPASPGTSA